MTNQPIRVALAGGGAFGAKHVNGLKRIPDVEVAAVVSSSLESGEAFAAEHGIGRVHGSYEDLLADPDIEAVYIPLPNSLHVPWSIKALEAGKHVLSEKPLTRRVADAEAAFDAADRAGRLLREAWLWRYHTQTEALVRLAGEIGPLRVVRAAFGFPMPPEDVANVRLQGSLEGGALMDVGCYCVSALRLLGGEPERVQGEFVAGGDGVDVRFAGVLRFAGDAVGTFDCGFDVPNRSAIEVVGEGGALVSADPWHGASPRLTLARPGEAPEEVPVEAANPYQLELEDLSAAIRSGTAPRLGRAAALGQARVIEALYAAADAGRAVAVG